MEPLILESCNATWLFDTEGLRFRRILKGIEVDGHSISTGWRTYDRLEFKEGSDIFIVVLSSDGSRLIQSWRHTEDCAQCGGTASSDFSVDDIEATLAGSLGLSASNASVG
jgi:hypothetical protein